MTTARPRHASDIDPRHVQAARSVIIEVWQLLATFRDAMVLIGGWVPELLAPNARPRHTGSIDVDLLLKPGELEEGRYGDLLQLLRQHGYEPTEEPFRYRKSVSVGGGDPVPVDVEFLVPRGSRRRRRGRRVPGFRAIDADGADLATRSTVVVSVTGAMPSGARNRVDIVVSSPAASLVMKAHALEGRMKEKDAYDIGFLLKNHPGGAAAVGAAIHAFVAESEVQHALEVLAEKFASPDHFGSRAVADFLDPADPDERAFLARDAFERVQSFLRAAQPDRERQE
jgi:hypothetical protein